MLTMKNIGTRMLVLLIILFIKPAMAQETPITKLSDEKLMQWFREAKFGMFIHFGAEIPERLEDSDLTRTEKYEIGVREFNPVDFEAKEWVRIAKEGGMKYIVFTTKHHDGFCKWDSDLTDWDVIDQTEFKRDIVAELAEACKEADIKLGFYYSIADWHHPEYDTSYSNRNGFHFHPNPKADITKYMDYMYGQLRELNEKYQPSLFWFDGSAGFRNPNRKRLLGQQEMVDMLNGYGAISNSRLGDDDALRYVNYLSMGDNMIPTGNIGMDFESAQTMNDSWHYNAADEDWKSPEQLLANLIDIVGKGGNYLLNVGPNSRGLIPEASVSRLKIMGDWLKQNGDAIYGVEAGPHPHDLGWGTITQRKEGENTLLYLNIVDWPKDGNFQLYGLNNKVVSARLLASGKSLSVESTYNSAAGLNTLTIQVPESAPDPYVSVIALEVEGDALMDQAILQQRDGTVYLDGFQAIIRDKEIVPNKLLKPLDHKTFTVPKKGEGIMPAHGMTLNGFTEIGQALTWDFRLVQTGTYKVFVVNSIREGQPLNADGRLKATIAGKSVENELVELERVLNPRMATQVMNSFAELGTLTLQNAGMTTVSLEVTSEFTDSNPAFRSLMLIPIEKIKDDKFPK